MNKLTDQLKNEILKLIIDGRVWTEYSIMKILQTSQSSENISISNRDSIINKVSIDGKSETSTNLTSSDNNKTETNKTSGTKEGNIKTSYQNHFLIMHCLYSLKKEFDEESKNPDYYLSIHPLHIQLLNKHKHKHINKNRNLEKDTDASNYSHDNNKDALYESEINITPNFSNKDTACNDHPLYKIENNPDVSQYYLNIDHNFNINEKEIYSLLNNFWMIYEKFQKQQSSNKHNNFTQKDFNKSINHHIQNRNEYLSIMSLTEREWESICNTKNYQKLRSTFRRKAMSAHPDRGGSDEAFKLLSTAYTALSEHLTFNL